jgi:hypothetical protein
VIEPKWETNIVLFIPKHTPKCHDITRLIFEGRHLDLSLRKAQIQKSAHLRKSVRFHVPGRLTTEMPFSTDDHEPPNWITAKLANLVWRMTPDCREVTRLTSEGRDRPLPLGTRSPRSVPIDSLKAIRAMAIGGTAWGPPGEPEVNGGAHATETRPCCVE